MALGQAGSRRDPDDGLACPPFAPHDRPSDIPCEPDGSHRDGHVYAPADPPRYRLNLEDLLAGDVLVRRRGNKNQAAGAVQAYQARLLGPQVAHWTHVGLHDGDGYLWDAMPGANVQRRTLAEFINEASHIAVSRYRHARIRPRALADALAIFSTARYDLVSQAPVLASQLARKTGEPVKPVQKVERHVICSTLVVNALRYALSDDEHANVMADVPRAVPAHFRCHDDFRSVDIHWLGAAG